MADLDTDWYVIVYYASSKVRSYRAQNLAQFALDHPEMQADLQPDVTHINEDHITRIHLVAPDWFPARKEDHHSGNPFAVTDAEKNAWRRTRDTPWNPRGIFRRAAGARRRVAREVPKGPGF